MRSTYTWNRNFNKRLEIQNLRWNEIEVKVKYDEIYLEKLQPTIGLATLPSAFQDNNCF